MPRLDKERQERLEPKRLKKGVEEIKKIGLKILSIDDTRIDFEFKNERVSFYPYSGWHTGKSIKDGRGFESLKKQLIND